MASHRAQEQLQVWALPLPPTQLSLQPQDQPSLRLLFLAPPRPPLMPPHLRPARHLLLSSAQALPLPQVQALRLHLPQPRVLAPLRPLPQSTVQPPLLLADRASVLHLPRFSRARVGQSLICHFGLCASA
jgi:hypothetical protein